MGQTYEPQPTLSGNHSCDFIDVLRFLHQQQPFGYALDALEWAAHSCGAAISKDKWSAGVIFEGQSYRVIGLGLDNHSHTSTAEQNVYGLLVLGPPGRRIILDGKPFVEKDEFVGRLKEKTLEALCIPNEAVVEDNRRYVERLGDPDRLPDPD